MEQSELELFRTSLQRATASLTGPGLDAALDELGWDDALAEDPRAAVSTLFELQGRANATSSALDRVIAAALGVDAAGAGVVLPMPGRSDPPGEVVGEGVTVRGVALAGLPERSTAVVVARAAAGEKQVAVVLDTADLTLRPVGGLDPELGLVEVTADGVREVSGTTTPVPDAAAWLAAGQLAVAHELVGAARAMLDLARDHALDRVQFGRPIAGFQAVRHRLSDTLVAIEAADAALAGAWDEGTPLAAVLAKGLAGRSTRVAARNCQQVLAGIGFTTEHGFHRHLRRALVLDRLLGDTRSLTRQVGDDLLRSRRLPAILPL
jgi:alkylation response protein AidB-like acyl-CoA dehydrogenase